ncbi:hypothetical protein QJQ45_027009, partial [Haematococcus lacustris]
MFGGMVDPCFQPYLFARCVQRIQLSSFDEGDTGCLKEQQLGEFLRTQAMELELLEDMQGFVTPAETYTSFKDVHVMWVNIGEYADLAIYHVVDEALDM